MSFGGSDLGVLEDLAGALGLTDSGGSFEEDWLSNPGNYLSSVLAVQHQRESLVSFIDDVLGGAERTTGPDGATWLPIVEEHAPDFTLYVVLDDRPADYVAIGLGAKFTATNPAASVTAHVPIFRAAKDGHTVPSPFLIGTPQAVITVAADITVDAAAPTPGQAHLGGIALQVSVPTAGGGPAPHLSLTLRQLQMPGATSARDLAVDASSASELEGAVLDLVLGLVRAQAAALPPGPLTALAGLLGLRDGVSIPSIPFHDLPSIGLPALAGWLESVLRTPASRTAWVGQLAGLLGGTTVGDEVSLTIGPATLRLAVNVATGSDGHTRLTPTLGIFVTANASAIVRADADLCTIDLGSGAATALPRLALQLLLGHRPDGGTVLLDEAGAPHVRVEAVRAGFALDAQRRPIFVLAADRVTIGTHFHETLDLSSPDAIAEVGGTVLGDVADELLGLLGPAADAVRVLLGLSAPAGHPEVPTLNLSDFLANPLGAVADHWHTVVTSHTAVVPIVIATLRDLIADAAQAALPVNGAGTEADPWRVAIAGPVELDAWVTGDRLSLGPAMRLVVDTIGQRCTRIETRVLVTAVEIDLAARSAAFLPGIAASLSLRARGLPQAVLTTPALTITADSIGLAARWAPASGFRAEFAAPNLAVDLGDGPLLVPIPVIDSAGHVTLDGEGWDRVEALLGAFAASAGPAFLVDLVGAFGWIRRQRSRDVDVHLRLRDVVVDPVAAFKAWLGGLAIHDNDLLLQALSLLSRLLGGSKSGVAGVVEGSGRPTDPWRVPLARGTGLAHLVVWIGPDGPHGSVTITPTRLQMWRPGLAGLGSAALADALRHEAIVADDIRALIDGRPDIAAGLEALVTRWGGTDGRVVPPETDPPGVTVQRFADLAQNGYVGSIDIEELLGRAPATVIRVAVAPTDKMPWPDIPADRLVDFTTAGLAPAAFIPPASATGEWYVALGGRLACRLASGDPDGVTGQAQRLQRLLDAFSGLAGGLVVVAEAAAGHAARRASDAVAAVTDLVQLGTPLGLVSFSVLDDNPAADTLRLLKRLLPLDTDDITDDADLANGRGLVDGLVSLLALDDPARELQPPSPLPGAPRAGLSVHAAFGVMSQPAIRRAMTAIVAAGLAERAQARADRPAALPADLHLAIRVSTPAGTPAAGDPTLDGWAQFDLGTLHVDDTGPHLQTTRNVTMHCGVGRSNGWLVGGPDPGRAPGTRVETELRRVSVDIELPVGAGAGDAHSVITLHEPRGFGLSRERWVVQPTSAPVPPGVDACTPALPEVRVLLSGFAESIGSVTTGPVGGLAAVLRAIGVFDASGGSVPDAIDHLLHDAAAHLQAVVANATSRVALVEALHTTFDAAIGTTPSELAITAGPAVFTLDFEARRVSVTAAGTPGAFGLASWSAHFTLDSAGAASGDVTIGQAGSTVAGGVDLRFSTPARLALRWYRPGLATPDETVLWPAPNADALARALARILPAELARIGFEFLRELDETARVVVDASLAAVGLLGPADAGGQRRVLLPVAFLADPAAWFFHNGVLGGPSGIVPAKLIEVLDGLKPLIGVAGGPGEWALTPGVTVRADTGAAGAARLNLSIDTSAFNPIPAVAGRLALGGSFSLTLPASGPPRPGVDLFVGVAGAASGRQAVHVTFGADLAVFVRPTTGADIPLYPTAAGLGQLAETAVTQALPFILDQIAGLSGNAGVPGQVGTLVATLGDALAVRLSGHFSGPALQTWAADPVAALVARLPSLSVTVLGQIATAVNPVLPAGASATVVGGKLRVHVVAVTVELTPSPLAISVEGAVAGIPAVDTIDFGIALNSTGITDFHVEVGPANIDAGGVSLRPFFGVHAGSAPAGGRRAELSLGLGGDRRVGARWLIGNRFDLVVVVGASEHTDPAEVALALLDAVLDIVASFVLTTTAFQNVLAKNVGASTVRDVLRGVVLDDAAPAQLDGGIFDPARLLGRVQRLAVNLAEAGPSITVDGGLTLGLAADNVGGGVKAVGVRISLAHPVTLVQSDVTISLEADARWIHPPGGPPPPDGIVIDVLNAGPGAGQFAFAPSFSLNGVGLRFGKESGPILDVGGVTLGSIALHLFGRVGSLPLAGGVELQFSDLAVGVGGASGGNPVAQGVLSDSGQGSSKLAPAFSPALAVQKHGNNPVLVSLRAGDGTGPWWLAIQKGFGPLYIEQVGFGVTVRQDELERISILLDGRVSLLGLTAAVDDLQLTFVVASNASVFDPSRWAVDLAGLAISSDLGGITLQGGLRKFGDGDTVQYVGMLLGRFAVYGLSVFGGYGHGISASGERFASFFAFGAVNGPIGGPPAFFVTGIGGGLGINRTLVVPTDMSRFDQYPFIKALDPSARPSDDPMAELQSLATYFPQLKGSFWFAAGLSFTSFALVDGIVVVSVQVGDGLQIALFGLARMALPRPQFPIVSIELGLIARFSSKEGVLWVQAQLTDNSWLLYPDVRLTGGFAFVSWFGGPNRGQFVLTIGGFHPRFHRDGYPEVPRLGFQWRIGPFISAKGEAYFALTSEAVMAGGRLEISATFGPAWAHVVFGADGIVYFDPFHLEVEVYASISAGVTIDVWIGEITISISIGARILVEGPKFHGVATFSVGPVDLEVEFGDQDQPPRPPLPWADFVRKYLEEASEGVARVVTAIPGKGALPPGTGPGGPTDTGTADGSAEKPFTVFAEFEIMVTTIVPTKTIQLGAAPLTVSPSSKLGLAPMKISDAATTLRLNFVGGPNGGDHISGFQSELHHGPSFPIGVWGQPQADDDRKVPAGDVIDALDGVRLFAVANIPPGLPPIDYKRRVEAGKRHPLPFVHETGRRPAFLGDAATLAALLPPNPSDAQVFAAGGVWMARAGNGRTAAAALRGERSAPMRFGSLTDGLAAATAAGAEIALKDRATAPPVDTRVHPPVAIGILTMPNLAGERPSVRTTVKSQLDAPMIVTAPPTVESVAARVNLAVPAVLHRVSGGGAAIGQGTIVATQSVPLTRVARGAVAAVGGRGAVADGSGRLAGLTSGLAGTPLTGALNLPATNLAAGEIAILRLPNAVRDVDEKFVRPRLRITGGAARIVAFAHGGEVLADATPPVSTTGMSEFIVPNGAERFAVAVAGDAQQDAAGLWGWHAGTALAYLGWASALGSGCVVRAEGAVVRSTRHRRTAGWIRGAELVAGTSIVVTRFAGAPTVVVVALDDPGNTDVGRGLSLGLDGATRRANNDGSPVPPLAIVRANRTFLIYDIVPTKGEAVVASVASEDGWHLAGVMASAATADAVADLLTDRGVDRAVKPTLPGVGGTRTLSWIEPKPPGSIPKAQGPRPKAQAGSETKRPAPRAKRQERTKRAPSAKRPAPTKDKKQSTKKPARSRPSKRRGK